MTERWLPLKVGGAWNPELRRTFDDASGVYAIRHKATGTVEYVGESHTGRGWTTLTRHFQDASGKFATRNQRWTGKGHKTWTSAAPGQYEAALWVTSRGVRKKEEGDEKAMALQAELIARWDPAGNRDDGTAAKGKSAEPEPPSPAASADEEDYFGSFAENPAPKLVDVPLERRADARTPDLFTGRTRLDEGAKARRDWKGEAERLARELAACRAAPPSAPAPAPEPAPAPPPKPVKKPEGYGALDAKGQAGMFKRNPRRKNPGRGELVMLGWLVSIVVLMDGRRRVLRFGARSNPAILAYRAGGAPACCVVVYKPVIVGASSAAAEAEYKRTHWGTPGMGERLSGMVLVGRGTRVLGPALEIVYLTQKGDDPELVEYWHTFGDHGLTLRKKPFTPPEVHAATIKGRQIVRLYGGTYTVTERGIIG